MSIIKFSFPAIGVGLALTLLAAAPLGAYAAHTQQGAEQHAAPWSEVPHRHGPPGKRWIHRYAHPVPAPAVQRSIRPKQYGPPSMKARSWVRANTAKAMCCDSWPARRRVADERV